MREEKILKGLGHQMHGLAVVGNKGRGCMVYDFLGGFSDFPWT
jgi:hypothetical protein